MSAQPQQSSPKPAGPASLTNASFSMKLAQFNWPPPPAPSSCSSRATALPLRRVGAGGPLGSTSELDVTDSAAAADLKNRAELWDVRAQIEREKLKQVAPYPFFGCPMRFSDEFAALQISQDGRFNFSETSTEVADDAESSPSRAQGRSNMRRVVTYEGVFTAPSNQGPEVDFNQTTSSAFKDHRKTVYSSFSSSTKTFSSSASMSQPVVSRAEGVGLKTEEPACQPGQEAASIEAVALVKHEIVELNGGTRLVLVERGTFRFEFAVSPFFQPAYVVVKVQNKVPGGPPPRRWRLPFIGTGEPIGGAVRRSASISTLSSGSGAEMMKTRRKSAVESSPFRSAASATFASPKSTAARRKLNFRTISANQLQMSQSASSWMVG